jgi:RNA polymerase sigma-70 factor (ECF subfamily)
MDLTPEQVLREYAPRVYGLAYRLLGNEADAEDVTQEVFLQLLRKLDTFRGESSFPTWLYRVTVNAALGYRRKRAARQARVDAGAKPEQIPEGATSSGPVRRWPLTPERLALEEETHQLIESASAGLPETYRDVFVLADVEQLPNQEIADLLGLSLAAVKSRLHRARLLMRDALAPHFEEAPA